MTNSSTLSKPDLVLTAGGPVRPASAEPEAPAPKGAMFANGRPIQRSSTANFANLSGVFRQMAELQQKFAEEVVGMEGALDQHQQRIDGAVTELPELKGRVNWLISTYYEQSQMNQQVRAQLDEMARDVSEVRHASARQDGQVELSQRDVAAIGRTVSERLEAISARLEAQEQRTGTAPSALTGLAEQIESLSGEVKSIRTSLTALTDTVRGLCAAQQKWQKAMMQMAEAFASVEPPSL